ncbi:V-type proton ATPase subunit D 1 [Papilio machaon]|uniref:V-type proton ATPase subunit D 1 n=1 Tax=Papilio machaon TaxID=76193 RepID=A0A194RIQ1_PAPMA|nr:V-type proton ATPase subunit D 1 [Papilio machaon]
MNTENRYPVTASLFMLREIKQRQEKVTRGHQLLKRKTEALRIRGRQAAVEMSATQAVLGHTLREAYISLAAIKFTNGESNALVLENVGQAQIRVLRTPENISGVATVSLQAVEDLTASDTLQYAGLGAGGHRTSEAKKAFREAVRILVKFASLRNTCLILDEAIKSTLRKVNGIEKVIMPKLRNTETYILMEMGEQEREEFHRLKMVKAKKNQKKITQSQSRDDEESIYSHDTSNPPCTRFFHTILYQRTDPILSQSDSAGDGNVICYPHNWDDEDLLF